ncbi:MAG TPA: hypothetical protein DIW23_05675 [Anaerolineae bacterium]|nr:hypothetical protein [Anaerolineae bacterium]
MTQPQHKKQIIKYLERITSQGYDHRSAFQDFLDLSIATMQALPSHFSSIKKTKQFAEDTPETKELFETIKDRYSRHNNWEYIFEAFSLSFFELIESTWDYQDTLGDVFMEFCNPNPHTGQFFTPFNVAKMMAQIQLESIESQIHQQIKKEAATKDPLLGAAVMASMIIKTKEEAEKHFFDFILPLASKHLKPVTVCDPTCGSGVMFIAAASCVPNWMLQLGLVQFYGMDIDMTCVKMAKLNVMIYGLNGFGIKCALSLSEKELATLPQAHQHAYAKAQADYQAGIPIDREQVMEEINNFEQLQMF